MEEVYNNSSNNTDQNMPKEFNMVKLSIDYDKTISSDFIVDTLEKAIYLVNDYLLDCPSEVLIGIALDDASRPLSCAILGMGNDYVLGDLRTNILRFGILSNASSLVIAHNHPRSTYLFISRDDINEIGVLQQLASYIGITFKDFIVVGNKRMKRAYYSWASQRVISHKNFIKSIKRAKMFDTPTFHISSGEVDKLLTPSQNNHPDSVEKIFSSKKGRRGLFGLG